MPILTIAGNSVAFPERGNSPDWAPAIIQFAEAVSSALSESIGTYDIPPQRLLIDTLSSGSQDINKLVFSPSVVQGAFIKYTVFRNTSLTTVTETGQMIINYNPVNPNNKKWELVNFPKLGDASVSFSINDGGQVTLSTMALSGLNHNGFLFYSGQSLIH